MRKCYVCDTPYQVLNSINHRYHEPEGYADIFIGNQFFRCKDIADALDRENLFSNVFVYDCPRYLGKLDYAISKFRETIDMCSCMKKWLHLKDVDLNHYDALYYSLYTRFSYGTRELNPDADVIFFEDGVGTYLGKELKCGFEARKKVFKLLGKEFPDLSYSKLLVNNLDYFLLNNSAHVKNVQELSGYSESDVIYKQLLYRVFLISKNDIYKNKRIIYLTEPHRDSVKHNKEIEAQILSELDNRKNDVLIRVHPRQDNERMFRDYDNDTERMLWELAVLDIDDESILISKFSTAQLVPKIMYNKEPKIIFTHRCFENNDKNEAARIDFAIENLKKTYSDPERIVVLKKVSDLGSEIERLNKCEYRRT